MLYPIYFMTYVCVICVSNQVRHAVIRNHHPVNWSLSASCAISSDPEHRDLKSVFEKRLEHEGVGYALYFSRDHATHPTTGPSQHVLVPADVLPTGQPRLFATVKRLIKEHQNIFKTHIVNPAKPVVFKLQGGSVSAITRYFTRSIQICSNITCVLSFSLSSHTYQDGVNILLGVRVVSLC